MKYPADWEAIFILEDGEKVRFRPEVRSDTELLWNMISSLSEKSLSCLLPPFTRERVEGWTNSIDYEKVLTLVAVIIEKGEQKIIGTATLTFNAMEGFKHKAELSMTVHDGYQDKGIGTAILKHLLEIAKVKGLRKVGLTVNTDNDKAIHLYKKVGFEIEGKLAEEHYYDGKFKDVYRMAVFL
jgi:RimJ/RimL family protein N-acetyltransferase